MQKRHLSLDEKLADTELNNVQKAEFLIEDCADRGVEFSEEDTKTILEFAEQHEDISETVQLVEDMEITQRQRDNYGYDFTYMKPIDSKEAALEAFDKGEAVYLLYPDNTEGMAETREDIENFGGYFGIEKEPKSEVERGDDLIDVSIGFVTAALFVLITVFSDSVFDPIRALMPGIFISRSHAEEEQRKFIDYAMSHSKFIDYAMSHNVRVNLCMLLVLMTGIKVGELCGLQWYDVDFRHNSIHIHQIIYRTSRPKSENQEPAIVMQECEEPREIPVPSVLMAELKKLHNRNVEYYVFSGKETPYEPRIAPTHLKKFLARSGVRNVSFNELRDSFIQNCINNGCDIMMTAKLLGTTSLNKLHDNFDWGDVPFIKSAEFMETMGSRLLSIKPHTKSAIIIAPSDSISRQQNATNYNP